MLSLRIIAEQKRDVGKLTVERSAVLVPLNTYAASIGMPRSTAWTHVQVGKVDANKVGKR